MRISPQECMRRTAFHEAGHAVVLIHYNRVCSAFILGVQSHLEAMTLPGSFEFLGRCNFSLIMNRKLGRFQNAVFSCGGPLAEVMDDELIIDPQEWWDSTLLSFSETDLEGMRGYDGNGEWRTARVAMKIIKQRRRELETIAETLLRSRHWTNFKADSVFLKKSFRVALSAGQQPVR